MKNGMKFVDDYIFSWDLTDTEFPRLKIELMRAEGNRIVCQLLAESNEKTGCASLLQVLDGFCRGLNNDGA